MQCAGTRLDPVTAAAGSAHARGRKGRSAGGGASAGVGDKSICKDQTRLSHSRAKMDGGTLLLEVGNGGLERSQPAADVALCGPRIPG